MGWVDCTGENALLGAVLRSTNICALTSGTVLVLKSKDFNG